MSRRCRHTAIRTTSCGRACSTVSRRCCVRRWTEPAFCDEDGQFIATTVLWRLVGDDRWHAGDGIAFPPPSGPYDDNGPDGSGHARHPVRRHRRPLRRVRQRLLRDDGGPGGGRAHRRPSTAHRHRDKGPESAAHRRRPAGGHHRDRLPDRRGRRRDGRGRTSWRVLREQRGTGPRALPVELQRSRDRRLLDGDRDRGAGRRAGRCAHARRQRHHHGCRPGDQQLPG